MRLVWSPRFFVLAFCSLTACSAGYKGVPPLVGPKDTPESALGERLFRDARFSRFFVENSHGNSNQELMTGDPSLSTALSARRGSLKNPFAGQAMSCVACHMVGDAQGFNRAGMRAYTDFTARTAIPQLGADKLKSTPRNTPTLIGSLTPRENFLLHDDGEFASIEDLIIGSLTGRNFGWLPGEENLARANLVKVLREDNGQGKLSQNFGKASYRQMFLAQDRQIKSNFKISEEYRFDMDTATDQQVIDRAVGIMKVYLSALQLSTTPEGVNNGSPYDQFLIKNKLPTRAETGESDEAYGVRLSFALQGLHNPQFIEEGFGEKELAGAKIFLARSTRPGPLGAGGFQVGNCTACHAPPHFTDFKFHNTGATQDEYDAVHGAGQFAGLTIPDYLQRQANHDAYLPDTSAHPHGTSRFRAAANKDFPGFTDLGAWNILLNPDYPAPQAALTSLFCPSGACSTLTDQNAALEKSIASFKTPSLRLLGMSDPYLHDGSKATLNEVLRFYQNMSDLARQGKLRNADPEIAKIEIDRDGVFDLNAFLNSLNEDYE